MVRVAIAVLTVVGLAGCAEDDCAPARVMYRGADLPVPTQAAPGTLYGAALLSATLPGIARALDGDVAVTACDGFAVLDRTFDVVAHGGQAPAGEQTSRQIAVSGGTVYLVRDDLENSSPETRSIAAYTLAGEPRWRAPFAFPDDAELLATSEGVYAAPGDGSITLYAATSGIAAALPIDGVVAVGGGRAHTARVNEHTMELRRGPLQGGTDWTLTWVVDRAPQPLRPASTGADGSLVVQVTGASLLDLGDRVLQSSRLQPVFVVVVEPGGGIAAAFELDPASTEQPLGPARYLALRPGGGIVLAGDNYVAYADARGIQRVHRLTGRADRQVTGLAIGEEGLAWLAFRNLPVPGLARAELDFAGQHFTAPGAYLFGIVP